MTAIARAQDAWRTNIAAVIAKPQTRVLLLVTTGSLLLRLVFLVPMTTNNAVELGDAQAYFARAAALSNIFSSLLGGTSPSYQDLAKAYTGTWPPLQSVLLSLGSLLFGHSLLVGRLMMVALSTLTTALVYVVTLKLSTRRAALFAAAIHATYPSFIHFSLRLFSETTYIFLTLLAVYSALLLLEAKNLRRIILLSAATGCLFGLGTLTRATGLAWIPIVAAWLGRQVGGFRRKVLITAVVLTSAGLTLLPWEVVLYLVEGRFVLVTTSSEINLYSGNNPWVGKGYEPVSGVEESELQEAVTRYSREHNVDISVASRVLALQTIREQPANFIQGGFSKWQATWLPDFQLYRYLLIPGYPPLGNGVILSILFVTFAGFCLFLVFAIWGLLNRGPKLRHRGLFLVLVGGAMAVHLIIFGNPRYSIPLLALLLPAAGHGLAYFGAIRKKVNRTRAIAAVSGLALMGVSIATAVPYEYSKIPASSYYTDLVRQIGGLVGREAVVSDQLLFRIDPQVNPGGVTFTILDDDFRFVDGGTRAYQWEPSRESKELHLAVRSQTASEPVRLQLRSERSTEAVLLSPGRPAWHAWQPSGLPGVEYRWIGSEGSCATCLEQGD